MKGCKSLEEFEKKLQTAINSQNMKNLMNLLSPGDPDCPFPLYFRYKTSTSG